MSRLSILFCRLRACWRAAVQQWKESSWPTWRCNYETFTHDGTRWIPAQLLLTIADYSILCSKEDHQGGSGLRHIAFVLRHIHEATTRKDHPHATTPR